MKTIVTFCVFTVLSISSLIAQTTIAVLPYKITYDGRIPKKYTPEMIADGQKQDGINYQVAMINSLTRMSTKRKYAAYDVYVLSEGELEGRLNEKKMTYAQLETMTNQQIADSLGVTHVVRGNANRTFIMSDEMSIGMTAVGVLTNQSLYNATSQINLINSLEETKGITLFSRGYVRSTTATRTDDRTLRDTFRKSSRKMFKRLKV